MGHKYQLLLGDQYSLGGVLKSSRKEGGRAWESQEVADGEDLGSSCFVYQFGNILKETSHAWRRAESH